MDENYIEVDFCTYCKKCKHEKLKETDSPCDECLDETVNLNTSKPVKFEEKD